MKERKKILVVDDEAGMRDMLSYELSAHGHEIAAAASGEEALGRIGKENFDLVICDIKMPRMGGLELLAAVKKAVPDLEVVMTTGYGTVETAVSAMKMGAYDFVQKPFNLDEILAVTEKALEKGEIKAMLGIYEMSNPVFSSLNLEELLPVMSRLAVRLLQADEAYILLADKSGSLQIAAGGGEAGRGKARLSLCERAAAGLPREKAFEVIDGPPGKDPRFSDVAGLEDIRSALVFPLVVAGRGLGILNVNRTARQEPFSAAAIRHASLFCAQIAQAANNAILYRELDEKMREVQKMQGQLVEAEKLGAIGRLAAGVAHEINNPLSSIRGFSELLLRSSNLSPQERKDVETIAEQSRRCGEIVQNLLRFSSDRKGKEERVDMERLAQASLQLMKHDLLRDKIEVETSFPKDLPAVQGDPLQLERVYLNLITNARQAMQRKGSGLLRISAAHEGGRVVLRFEDNGCGIPPEDLNKVFDPFFTTKPVGQGTGLGLSISYGIIRRYMGDIAVHSRVGEGTTFTVSLPAGKDLPLVPPGAGPPGISP